jgi:Protein of unknown function (DUF1580)
MFELLNETRVSFPKQAQEEGVHVSTVWRWALRGVKGHRLESFSLGGRRYTTREAFARFVAATNDERVNVGQTPRQREREIDAAEKELDALGA